MASMVHKVALHILLLHLH